METKKEYMAPELTVVTVKAERGYAASNLSTVRILNQLLGLNLGGGSMEEWYPEDNSFNDAGGFTWDE
jgi:hypothetical protein